MNVAYNMDCLAAMREMPDECFDLAVVDPPYRDVAENQPFQQMRAKSDPGLFVAGKPSEEFFIELARVSKEQIVFGANNFGYPFKGFIAWDKLVRGSDKYSQVEIASLSEGLSTVSTLVQITTYTTDPKIHPTQKPVALYAWIFRHYAKPGMKILDTHLGSGSSRIAAYDAGLDFVGYEIDKAYFDLQEERFAAHAAQQSLFIPDQDALW